MSLHIEFEPHSWYMGFAIKHNPEIKDNDITGWPWEAYTADGNTYQVVELTANTLEQIRHKIRSYHIRKHNGYGERIARRRLEYLRGELRAERMSYGESNELMGLSNYIEPGDVELLEAAGVPEHA